MTKNKLEQAAKVAFASTFSFYLKAHNFHWNVTGPDFLEYHDLFGKVYSEVYDIIDEFAEEIRGIDAFVPGSLAQFNMLTKIPDETKVITKEAMLKELLADNDKMLDILKYTYDTAEAAGECGFSNFLASRLSAHKKHGWWLKSSLKAK